MKKIDLAAIPVQTEQNYPAPFDAPCIGQGTQRLGRAAGLTAFGVNLSRLPPGVWSSQRHWHTHEDEFVMVVEGELTLVTDAGDEILRPGDCAAFKAGERDGHHLINRSQEPAELLVVGARKVGEERIHYPDQADPGPFTVVRDAAGARIA